METLQDRTIDPSTKLTRIAPDGREWVLYDTAQENDFLSWWLQTDYGQQLSTNGRSKVRWSAGSRSSEVWKHFDQVAELRSGRPKVICRSCLASLNHPHHKFHGTSAMGKHLKSKICRRSKRKVSFSAVTLSPVQEARAVFSPKSTFTKAHLEEQLVRTITSANLSFNITEEPAFRELLNLVHAESHILEFPTSRILHQRMRDMTTTYQESQLQDLPRDCNVSIALCCWKNPIGDNLMAVTAYYLDKEWRYREVLLGLEPLCDQKTELDPCDQVIELIREKGLLHRIFSVTIDHRVDDNLVLSLQKKFISSGGITAPQCFVRVPGTVQAIRLCLMRYIDNVTAVLGCATAENVQPVSYVNGWTDISDEEEIPRVLEKVYGPRSLGEKWLDLHLHIADPLICKIYQRDPTEAR